MLHTPINQTLHVVDTDSPDTESGDTDSGDTDSPSARLLVIPSVGMLTGSLSRRFTRALRAGLSASAS
eukprot:2504253-Prymnesium_polylepis.1